MQGHVPLENILLALQVRQFILVPPLQVAQVISQGEH